MTKVNGSSGTSIQPTQSTGGVRELKLGNRGADVTALQQQLNQLGYPCDVDGKYGEQTFEAVKAFQAANGLSRVDGIVGSETRGALANPKAVPPNKKDNVNVQQQDDPNKKRNNDILNYPTRVSDAVSTDLEKASHDWTASGYFNDIRKTLAEATTPADFRQVAAAARNGRLTAEHADTIEAIAGASTDAVRLALRDAYANPRENGMNSLAAAQAACRTPADRIALQAVAKRLNAEGLTNFQVSVSNIRPNGNNRHNNA